MEKVINVSSASISTVTIEVKVMRIGNRQVTLAVFRQLPEKKIIDHLTGELRGIPWGRVNYHVGCEEDDFWPHLHIVWQLDNELYRAVARGYHGYSQNDLEYFTKEELRDIGRKWEQSYAQLEQLDQLFIAV